MFLAGQRVRHFFASSASCLRIASISLFRSLMSSVLGAAAASSEEPVLPRPGAKGEKPEVVRFAAEPGLYVFEVRDLKNREANFQDSYQLTVEEGQE